jgi:hypothetical protein
LRIAGNKEVASQGAAFLLFKYCLRKTKKRNYWLGNKLKQGIIGSKMLG